MSKSFDLLHAEVSAGWDAETRAFYEKASTLFRIQTKETPMTDYNQKALDALASVLDSMTADDETRVDAAKTILRAGGRLT